MVNKKILFCGGGNMAEGIIRSIIGRGTVEPENIAVSEIDPSRCSYLNDTYGVTAVTDAAQVMAEADVAVIAVLPKVVPLVTKDIKKAVKEDALIISIAAGVRIESLEEQLGADRKIIRVMPNTLNQSGNGYSALCFNGNVTECEKDYVKELIGALGQTMYISEDMFEEFTAFSCSGPMWIYQMVEGLIDAGVYNGFSRKDAANIVIKNLKGVAMVLDESDESPKDKINEMCSPGGVAIEGYKSLQEEGFTNTLMTSMSRAVDKVKSIG